MGKYDMTCPFCNKDVNALTHYAEDCVRADVDFAELTSLLSGKPLSSEEDMKTSELKERFIDWFLSIPDVDETLIAEENQDLDGFCDEIVQALFSGFKAGFASGQVCRV